MDFQALNRLSGDPEIFRLFAIGLTSLILGAGVLLLFLRLFGKRLESVWRTYLGWWFILPPVLLALASGRVGVVFGLVLVALFAFKEFARATGLYRDWALTSVVYLGIFALGVFCFMIDPRLGTQGWYGMFMALPVYVIAAIFLVPIARNRSQGQLQSVALAVLGFVYVGWMFLHLAFLANLDHARSYLLFLLCAVQLNDIAAFTFGKLFGRAKFREVISPNKTWAGALGALGFSMLLPWLLGFALPHFDPVHKLVTGLVVGIGGQLGDLSISFVKRDLGVKDMGAAIPGHGGLLDRIDSLIYVAPLFFHVVRWFFGAGSAI